MFRVAEGTHWNNEDFLAGLPAARLHRYVVKWNSLPRVIVESLYDSANGHPQTQEILSVIKPTICRMRVQFESVVQYQIMEQDISFGEAQSFLTHVRDTFGNWM